MIANFFNKRSTLLLSLALLLIFVIFASFRFINIDKRIIFDWDQEQFTNQVKDIVVNHKFTLLGPRVVSDSGFFLAPYFTYLIIPFYVLTNLHPNAMIPVIILVDTLFFIASFFILKRTFGLFEALFFNLLWSINSLLIFYDTIPWWPILIPLGTILTIGILHNIYEKNRDRDWILLGITLGFFMNMHFQFIFIIFFSAIFILVSWKKIYNIKKIVLSKVCFLLMFLPLIMFDIRHNFLNVHLFFNFFLHHSPSSTFDPIAWLPVFVNVTQPLLFFKEIWLSLLFYVAVLAGHIYLVKKHTGFSKSFFLASAAVWLFIPAAFTLYGKRPSEYYFLFSYIFIFIILIKILVPFYNKYMLIALTIILFFINILPSIELLKPHIFGLYNKDQTIQLIKEKSKDDKIALQKNIELSRDNGFEYLISWYGLKINHKDSVTKAEINVPLKNTDTKFGGIGINFKPL